MRIEGPPNKLRIALAGGGNKEDSQLLDAYFARWMGTSAKMLYLPIALREPEVSFNACYEWIRSVFAPFDIKTITMWTDLNQHRGDKLDAFDSIYIGGGNTFSLFAQLLETGLAGALREYVTQGGAIYGGSAGAVILGRDLLTVEHMDSNDVGLVHRSGLDLVGGHAIWVHYTPEDDDLIRCYIRRNNIPVLAIAERAGIVAEGNKLIAIGHTAVYRFDAGIKEIVR